MKTFKEWLRELSDELSSSSNTNPRVFIKAHLSSLRYLYINEQTVDEVVAYFVYELASKKKQELLEKLRSSRGTVSLSDPVLYDGKMLKRCPKGTKRAGNSCAPSGPNLARPNMKDSGQDARRQIERLSKARSSKDVHQAYNISKNRDRKNSKAP